jgi:hypothetical protein
VPSLQHFKRSQSLASRHWTKQFKNEMTLLLDDRAEPEPHIQYMPILFQ